MLCISDMTKELECEADHLPSSTTEAENAQGFIHKPSYVVIIWCHIRVRIFVTNFIYLNYINQNYIHTTYFN